MGPRVTGTAGLFALLVVAWALMPAAALSAVARRTWQASLSGGSGSIILTLKTDYSGTVTVSLGGLKPSQTYSQMVYQGSCVGPSSILKLPSLLTTATGVASRSVRFGRVAGIRLWTYAARGEIAFRVASGADRRCGRLTYPVTTRVSIPRYGIDLPVVLQRGQAFPLCDVAMYVPAFSQPHEAGPTFVYAHARAGMFLPLLTASRVNNGRAMIGMTVAVWTSDSQVITYRVTRVLRHLYSVPAYDESVEQLWLQTSEGPYGTYNKLFLVATPISTHASTYADAHPAAHPVVCGLYH
jgi:hypothetical protein